MEMDAFTEANEILSQCQLLSDYEKSENVNQLAVSIMEITNVPEIEIDCLDFEDNI